MADAQVADAAGWAKDMLRWESRGPGDAENAMRRLASRHRLSYGTLWALRYRMPKRIWADVYVALANAYNRERERQLRALEHEAKITTKITGAHHPAVVAAASVVGAANGEKA